MTLTDFLEYTRNAEMLNAFCKAQQYLNRCEKAHCSISGGADRDVMLDLIIKADTDKKVSYGFYNTGIEYEATKRHLDYLRNKYGVEIKEYRAKCPVPLACKKYGQPFLSKFVSEMIQRLQRHGFKWEDKPFEELLVEYPKCKAALKWWCNLNGKKADLISVTTNYLKNLWLQIHLLLTSQTSVALTQRKMLQRMQKSKNNATL